MVTLLKLIKKTSSRNMSMMGLLSEMRELATVLVSTFKRVTSTLALGRQMCGKVRGLISTTMAIDILALGSMIVAKATINACFWAQIEPNTSVDSKLIKSTVWAWYTSMTAQFYRRCGRTVSFKVLFPKSIRKKQIWI
jgi:hypothetical protein